MHTLKRWLFLAFLAVALPLGAATTSQTEIDLQNATLDAPARIVANQSVAYTGTAGTSAAVNASTAWATVTCTTDCYVVVSANPTATTSDLYLPAYTPSPRLRMVGGTSKISIIRDSASGTAKIGEFMK